MPNVHHIGPKVYVHQMTYPSTAFPLAERGTTQEIEYPFRCGQSVVIRLPFTTRAMAFGVWTGKVEESMALEGAIGAKWIGDVR